MSSADKAEKIIRDIETIIRREEARNVVRRIPDLVARPLLLTYVEDLTVNKGIDFAFQIYEAVVQRWCAREDRENYPHRRAQARPR